MPEWLFGGCIYREERAIGYLDDVEGRAPFDLIRDVKSIGRCGVAGIRFSLHGDHLSRAERGVHGERKVRDA